jgi:hypothetical protein
VFASAKTFCALTALYGVSSASELRKETCRPRCSLRAPTFRNHPVENCASFGQPLVMTNPTLGSGRIFPIAEELIACDPREFPDH